MECKVYTTGEYSGQYLEDVRKTFQVACNAGVLEIILARLLTPRNQDNAGLDS